MTADAATLSRATSYQGRRGISLAERYWAKVNMTPGQGPHGDCWGWHGSTDEHGYGQLALKGGKGIKRAHVVSYEIHIGPVPDGLEVCHDCHNPPCSNPHHLLADTHQENIRQSFVRRALEREIPISCIKPSELIIVPEEFEQKVEPEQLEQLIHSAVIKLNNKQQQVIIRRFGLDGEGEHTLEELGKEFKLTRERIRQIEAKALERLRHPAVSKELRAALAA